MNKISDQKRTVQALKAAGIVFVDRPWIFRDRHKDGSVRVKVLSSPPGCCCCWVGRAWNDRTFASDNVDVLTLDIAEKMKAEFGGRFIACKITHSDTFLLYLKSERGRS